MALLFMLWFSIGAVGADSDQVILANGDHFRGHVLKTTPDVISLATEAAGVINIRQSTVKQVILATEVPAKPSDKCTANGKPALDSWSLSLQGAPNKVVLGTQSQEQFGAGVDLSLCDGSKRDTTELVAKGNHARTYKEKGASIQTDVSDAEIKQQHFFSSPQGAAVFAIGDFFTNNSLGMAMQKSAGVGLLSPQYQSKTLFYDFAIDLRYVNEHLDHSSPALNLAGLKIRQQTHSQGTIFSWAEEAWVMPMLNNIHGLQAHASIGPSLTLKKWLRLGLTEEEHYLGNAPPPNRKNYLSSSITLTIQGAGSFSRE